MISSMNAPPAPTLGISHSEKVAKKQSTVSISKSPHYIERDVRYFYLKNAFIIERLTINPHFREGDSYEHEACRISDSLFIGC